MSTETNQSQRSEEQKITGLRGLVERSCFEALGAAVAAIELDRIDRAAGERLIGMVNEKLGFLDSKERPDNAARKIYDSIDLETDLEPAIEWLRFRDGLTALNPEGPQQMDSNIAVKPELAGIGDPVLQTIKRYLGRVSFQEKLTAVLLWQLINKETEFEKPDKGKIGNDYYRQWQDDIIKTCGDPKYLEGTDPDEAQVAGVCAMMLYWEV